MVKKIDYTNGFLQYDQDNTTTLLDCLTKFMPLTIDILSSLDLNNESKKKLDQLKKAYEPIKQVLSNSFKETQSSILSFEELEQERLKEIEEMERQGL